MPSTLILLKLNKELEFLKNKAEQQEDKMIEDDRIINLQKNLTWFKDESKRLKGLKDKNDIAITAITDQNKQLVENKNYIEGKVKASIR